MLALAAERKKIAKQFPNLIDYEAKRAFSSWFTPAAMPVAGTPIETREVRKGFLGIRRVRVTRPFRRSGPETLEKLRRTRIGMPRVLNMYSTGPYFRTYFEALGLPKQNVVFSDATTEELWVAGGKYGSIDPCFPSKVAQAHIHDLLFNQHDPEKGRALKYIFFPILTHVPSFGEGVMDKASCPIVAGAPDVMKAAFTKETDFFAQRGIEYLDPALTFNEPALTAHRMFQTWGPRLGITEDESDHAHEQAMRALTAFESDLQDKGRAILETPRRSTAWRSWSSGGRITPIRG
jgi:predicted nucleotide-binding protein (sugar kinase/HSP70/actin superfamily)